MIRTYLTFFGLIVAVLSILEGSEAKASWQDPSANSPPQPGEERRSRPAMPWSRWMSHRGPHLLAFSEGEVQKELFGPPPHSKLPRTMQEARRDAQKLMKQYGEDLQGVLKNIRYEQLDEQELRRIAAEFSRVNQSTEEKLQSVLPAETWRRLNELTLWLSIRDHGLIDSLLDGFESSPSLLADNLAITAAQKEEWKRQTPIWKEEYDRELCELEKRLAERLSESLEPKQRQLLKQRLILMEIAAERVSPRESPHNGKRDRSSPSHNTQATIRPPSIRTMMASLEYTSDSLANHADPGVHRFPWRDYYLPTYEPQPMLNGDLVSYAMQLELIELSAEQHRQLKVLTEQKKERVKELQQKWPSWNDRDSVHRDEFINAYREFEDRQSKTMHEQVLLPHQSDVLNRTRCLQLVRRHGLLPLLTDGSLARELEVSQSQRKQLFESVPEVKAAFVDELRELDARTHAKILAVLEPPQRRRIEQALGELPSHDLRGTFGNQ